MSNVTSLTFNAFQENTYIISDDSGQAVIIDPGCHSQSEKEELSSVIDKSQLKIHAILNTHCHADHVFGNNFVFHKYSENLLIPKGEEILLQAYPQMASMYGLPSEPSPTPTGYLEHGQDFSFGQVTLRILLTPGHSPASVSFYNEQDHYIIGGDVLFQHSIGRTDLPGGDYETLINSIQTHFLSLPDRVVVYSGHGPKTTIGEERKSNPFLQS